MRFGAVAEAAISGGANYMITKKVAGNSSLRWGLWDPKAGEDPSVYSDVRFVGGLAAAGVSMFADKLGGKWAERIGDTALNAAVGSLAATEGIRAAAAAAKDKVKGELGYDPSASAAFDPSYSYEYR